MELGRQHEREEMSHTLELTWVVVEIVLIGLAQAEAAPRQGTASYYTVESAIREGTCTDPQQRRCLMANGRALDDKAFTAASWDFPLNSRITVCAGNGDDLRGADHDRQDRREGSHCVVCRITDRGPAKRLYRHGRILDFSQAAFQALAPLTQGIVQVTVEVRD